MFTSSSLASALKGPLQMARRGLPGNHHLYRRSRESWHATMHPSHMAPGAGGPSTLFSVVPQPKQELGGRCGVALARGQIGLNPRFNRAPWDSMSR